jgi:hypothetical protein
MTKLEIGKVFTRLQISELLGGNQQQFLPIKNGRVTCCCFKATRDRLAPQVLLVGGPRYAAARVLAQQAGAIPFFRMITFGEWRYIGDYKVTRSTEDPEIIAAEKLRGDHGEDVRIVLYNEAVPLSNAK